MYSRIILGYDASEQSHDALALARLIAAQGSRSVVVTHVSHTRRPTTRGPRST